MQVLDKDRLFAALSKRLGKVARIVVCGVGNELRGDDAVGLYVARRLSALGMPSFATVMACGEVPENYLSEVVAHAPSHLILVDAAHAGLGPGTLVLVEGDEISEHAISTHRLPLSLFCRMVTSQTGHPVDVFILGVQVKSCGFGEALTPVVRDGADSLVAALGEAFKRLKARC